MMTSIFCFICFLLPSAVVSYLLSVDQSTFGGVIRSADFVLVSFLAPWCIPCTTLLTELHAAALQLHTNKLRNIKLAFFDVTQEGNKEVVLHEQITAYPTLVLYNKDGERLAIYDGPRTNQDIYEYLRKQSGRVYTQVSTFKEIHSYQAMVNAEDLFGNGFMAIALGVLPPIVDEEKQKDVLRNDAFGLFCDIAGVVDSVKFLVTDDVKLLSHYGMKEDTILMFTGGDSVQPIGRIHMYDDTMESTQSLISPQTLMYDVLRYALPLIINFNSNTAEMISMIPIKQQVLLFYPKLDVEHIPTIVNQTDKDRLRSAQILSNNHEIPVGQSPMQSSQTSGGAVLPIDVDIVKNVDDLLRNLGRTEVMTGVDGGYGRYAEDDLIATPSTPPAKIPSTTPPAGFIEASSLSSKNTPLSSVASQHEYSTMEEEIDMTRWDDQNWTTDDDRYDHHIDTNEFKIMTQPLQQFNDVIERIAEAYRGRILFIRIPATEHAILQHFRMDVYSPYSPTILYTHGHGKASSIPQIVALDMTYEANPRRYVYTDFIRQLQQEQQQKEKQQSPQIISRYDQNPTNHPELLDEFFNRFLAHTLSVAVFTETFVPPTTTATSTGTSTTGGTNEQKKHNQQGVETTSIPSSPLEFDTKSTLVTKIVAQTINPMIINNQQMDTFLYVYTPWCGHCKAFEPVLEQLAYAVRHDDLLQIAKIDASKNEVLVCLRKPVLVL